jgi:kumamolisin
VDFLPKKFFSWRLGRQLAGWLGCLLLLLPTSGCLWFQQNPLAFVSYDLGLPQAALNAPVVGPLPDSTKLHIGITFKVNQGLLNKLGGNTVTSHQKSDLEKQANQLGIDDGTYQKIKDFFNTKGIALKLSKLHTHLNIDASAKTVGKVLQTSFVQHKLNNRVFFTPKTAPKLPQFLADSIVAITGLDNFSSAPTPRPVGLAPLNITTPGASKHVLVSDQAAAKAHPTADCGASDRTLLPRQVAHAYGYDQLWNRGLHGENMTVNLVEIDAADSNDVQNYLDCVNFQGQVQFTDVDGAPTSSLGENTLDIQMVAGLARSSNINVYETDGNTSGDIWTNVNDELQQIINDNTNNVSSGQVVSISLGAGEDQVSSQAMRAIDQSLQILNQSEHMTVFVASGDCGAFADQRFGHLSVSFPASDPWATAVGGTTLQVDGNGNRANETAWSSGSNPFSCKNRWGTGGGNSQVFGHPGWQNGNGVQNSASTGARQVPDISAVAYALAIYYNGQWGGASGTSAAAPIWAAGMVLMNQGLMKDTGKFTYSPRLFYDAQAGGSPYNDITSGTNLHFRAGPGWDYTTGLGSPNLASVYQRLAQLLRR